MNIDEKYIDKTFELAIKGKGFVSPNPMVSCVIVRDDTVLTFGYHKSFGGPHAEVEAIINANESLKGATAYVNLAPCCHTGKTGPCTEALIKAGISRVVYSNDDPNPLVADESRRILEQAGIEVISGVLEERGYQLNKKYFKWIKTRKPYVTLKAAMTLDGKIAAADYSSKWITGESSRKYVHELRRGYDAILVGANTVVRDNPNLGLHGSVGKDPLRLILTFDPSKFDDCKYLDIFRDNNYAFIQSLADFENFCSSNNVSSVLVEGGAGVFTSFLKSGLIDDLYLFYGAKILGDEHVSVFGCLGLPGLKDSYGFNVSSVANFKDGFLVKLEN